MAERDKYYGDEVQLADPANQATPIVPDQALAVPGRAMYVGGGGDINMQGTDDAAPVLWKNVPAGSVLPFRVVKVVASGTTATNMLSLN